MSGDHAPQPPIGGFVPQPPMNIDESAMNDVSPSQIENDIDQPPMDVDEEGEDVIQPSESKKEGDVENKTRKKKRRRRRALFTFQSRKSKRAHPAISASSSHEESVEDGLPVEQEEEVPSVLTIPFPQIRSVIIPKSIFGSVYTERKTYMDPVHGPCSLSDPSVRLAPFIWERKTSRSGGWGATAPLFHKQLQHQKYLISNRKIKPSVNNRSSDVVLCNEDLFLMIFEYLSAGSFAKVKDVSMVNVFFHRSVKKYLWTQQTASFSNWVDKIGANGRVVGQTEIPKISAYFFPLHRYRFCMEQLSFFQNTSCIQTNLFGVWKTRDTEDVQRTFLEDQRVHQFIKRYSLSYQKARQFLRFHVPQNELEKHYPDDNHFLLHTFSYVVFCLLTVYALFTDWGHRWLQLYCRKYMTRFVGDAISQASSHFSPVSSSSSSDHEESSTGSISQTISSVMKEWISQLDGEKDAVDWTEWKASFLSQEPSVWSLNKLDRVCTVWKAVWEVNRIEIGSTQWNVQVGYMMHALRQWGLFRRSFRFRAMGGSWNIDQAEWNNMDSLHAPFNKYENGERVNWYSLALHYTASCFVLLSTRSHVVDVKLNLSSLLQLDCVPFCASRIQSLSIQTQYTMKSNEGFVLETWREKELKKMELDDASSSLPHPSFPPIDKSLSFHAFVSLKELCLIGHLNRVDLSSLRNLTMLTLGATRKVEYDIYPAGKRYIDLDYNTGLILPTYGPRESSSPVCFLHLRLYIYMYDCDPMGVDTMRKDQILSIRTHAQVKTLELVLWVPSRINQISSALWNQNFKNLIKVNQMFRLCSTWHLPKLFPHVKHIIIQPDPHTTRTMDPLSQYFFVQMGVLVRFLEEFKLLEKITCEFTTASLQEDSALSRWSCYDASDAGSDRRYLRHIKVTIGKHCTAMKSPPSQRCAYCVLCTKRCSLSGDLQKFISSVKRVCLLIRVAHAFRVA